MKLKKIAAICKKDEAVYLFDVHTGKGIQQWVGTSRALYPIDGIPYLDLDALCTIFDIPEKKRQSMYLKQGDMPEFIDPEHYTDSEIDLGREIFTIIDDLGREMKFLQSERSEMLVFNRRYLSPLNEDYITYHERSTYQGGAYIAVKSGMLLQAIIMPSDIIDDEFVRKLSDISGKCARAMAKKGPLNPGQLRFDGNGEIVEDQDQTA
jgi:hypothetical protein